MPRNKELVELRNERIRKVYEQMRAKRTASGKFLHTVEFILDEISRKHVFVGIRTIEEVLYGSGEKKRPSRTKA